MAKLKDHPISELTIKIEHKYGSVLKCPDNDPMLIELHKLTDKTLNVSNKNNGLKNKARRTKRLIKKKAHDLALQGYTDVEIERELSIKRSTIRNWLRNLKERPAKFTRIVVAKSTGNRIYFSTSKGVQEWCGQLGYKFSAVNQGKDDSFEIQKNEIHWVELPIGAVYQNPRQHDEFYIKENNASYVQGEQYYF